jgi:D-serine deaminase-like pyridoxal phosphate-dependent protein
LAEFFAKEKDAAANVAFMVDSTEHLDQLNRLGEIVGAKIRLVFDLDVATTMCGVKFGVYRSSNGSPKDLRQRLEHLKKLKFMCFAGCMSYEAQIDGVADQDPKDNFVVAMIQRILKKLSLSDIRKKRALFANVIKDFIPADQSEGYIYNCGGSGSVSSTPNDLLVNEITIGSGILAPPTVKIGFILRYIPIILKQNWFA